MQTPDEYIDDDYMQPPEDDDSDYERHESLICDHCNGTGQDWDLTECSACDGMGYKWWLP